MGEVALFALLALFVYLTLVVHELGHYLALQRFGVAVHAVAFGGPPWVLRWRRKGTEFRLGLLPLLAFVDAKETELDRLSHWRYVLALLAGPLANFAAALLGGVALALLQGGVEPLFKVLGTVVGFPLLVVGALHEALQNGAELVMGFRDFAQTSTAFMQQGVTQTVVFWVALNTALGWFNLIPLPPLDGGQAIARFFVGRRGFALVYRIALVVGVGANLLLLALALLKDFGLWG